MKTKTIIISMFVLLFCGCDMFEYHPYGGKVKGETDINANNIAIIEETCKNKATIRFIMMGDTQRWYDETQDFVKAVNKRDDIDFVIHGGDISDFGFTKEFTWIRDIMNDLKVPYVALIGNHDCLANGKRIYRTIFGEENFSFMAGPTKFVCLDTNALEYDYSNPVPNFDFIEQRFLEKKENHINTVFVMHARPYSDQFNNNIAPYFQQEITKFPNLMFCLNAHDHIITADDLFNDGIIYYGCQNILLRNYLLLTLTPDNKYTYEVVYF